MARALVLRFFELDGKPLGEQRCGTLPVRIGRNALNDCQLAHKFVSDFHARLEEADGRIFVRDLNSKNGIFLRSDNARAPVRVAPQMPIDLGPYHLEFFVGPFLRVLLEPYETDAPLDRDPKSSSGSVLGNRRMLEAGLPQPPPWRPGEGTPVHAGPGRSWTADPQPHGPSGGSVPPFLAGGRSPPTPAGSLPALPNVPALAPLPPLGGAPNQRQPMDPNGRLSGAPGAPDPYLPAPYQSGPSAPPPPPQGVPGYPGPDLKRTGHFALGTEALALQGLRELAGSLVPGQPLDTTGDVARLITKLHDALEVFCRCFIPLREGYAQFVSGMDLQRAAMQRSANRSRGYMAVEMANNPAAVAAALLDWRDPSLDAPKAVEGIFADLMIHQLALLDGVMKGVRALLDELAPENIEKELDERDARGPLGLSLGRHKVLWEAYREKYEQLSEEKQAFSHILGPEFSEAYREYRRRRSDTARSG